MTGIAMAAMLAVAPLAAHAQSTDEGASQQTQEQMELSEQKLDAFVDAAVEVIGIRNQWQPRIQGAESESEAEEMMQTARQEMVQAVEDAEGITPREYGAIAQAAQQNPQLAQAIQTRMREAMDGQ